MAAEFHLAEDTLALHLLLSTLRACSTLLSRTRTCTRRSSSIERLKGPMAKGPGPLARIGIIRMPMAPDVRTKVDI